MVVGEHPDKVSNIVTANLQHFRRLYDSRLQVRVLYPRSVFLARAIELTIRAVATQKLAPLVRAPVRLASAGCSNAGVQLQQDTTLPSTATLFDRLPSPIRSQMSGARQRTSACLRVCLPFMATAEGCGGATEEEWWQDVAKSTDANARSAVSTALAASLAAAVGRYAKSQSLKGLITGGVRSGEYIYQKLGKWAQGVAKRARRA